MSRFHYIYTDDGLKVFVPGCMGCVLYMVPIRLTALVAADESLMNPKETRN